MIPAFIVLLVIALALGAYIAFDAATKNRKPAAVDTAEASETAPTDTAPAPDEHVETTASEAAPAASSEAETAEPPAAIGLDRAAENGELRYIVIEYSKSFLAKLIQSDDRTKRYYSEIKNRLLSYAGVKSRICWKCESFRSGRRTLARLRLRGKTLSLCLALNADDYAHTKYRVENLADIKAYADTPCIYRIKNDRRLKYAEQLTAALMERNGIAEIAHEQTDYAEKHPYETTEALVERKLIKKLTDRQAQSGTAFEPRKIRQSVTAREVDGLMRDEVAAHLIKSEVGVSNRAKQSIINIDTVSEHFESGEVVTLDEIKKRVKGFNKQTTYLKVLARGTLDKALTVEADGFSLQAVKMIVLTGGTAIKKSVKK